MPVTNISHHPMFKPHRMIIAKISEHKDIQANTNKKGKLVETENIIKGLRFQHKSSKETKHTNILETYDMHRLKTS